MGQIIIMDAGMWLDKKYCGVLREGLILGLIPRLIPIDDDDDTFREFAGI
jgi:hypothetical protein